MSFITSRDSSHSTLYRSCYHLHLIALPSNQQASASVSTLARLRPNCLGIFTKDNARDTFPSNCQFSDGSAKLMSAFLTFRRDLQITRRSTFSRKVDLDLLRNLTPLSVVESATHLESNETAGCIRCSQSFTSSLSRHVICIICSNGAAIHQEFLSLHRCTSLLSIIIHHSGAWGLDLCS